MKQKYPKWLQIGAVILFGIYWFFTQNSSEKTADQTQTKKSQSAQKSTTSATQSAVKQSNVSANYDTIMRDDAIGQNANAPVDYYMLALSWSPAFCESQAEKYGDNLPQSSQMQCGTQRQYGWVIHGLWAQNANAKSVEDQPRFCQGDLPQLDYALIEPYLAESPSPNLLQGEWEKHGACGFKTAQAYFEKQRELYRALTLPTEQMNRKELFRWLKQHNSQLKNAYMNASRSELFICYDLAWNVMNCPSN